MNKIKCIITDDEPFALDLMQKYVQSVPFLELVGRCNSVSETMALLEQTSVDLLFLDIQMPNISGMAFAKTLGEYGPKVIFTTAFEQYALESYRVNAVDYLLKPFAFEEFMEAVQKVRKLIDNKPDAEHVQVNKDYILLKADYKIWQIALDDILYFEGIKDYVRVHRKSTTKTLMSLGSLKSLESSLPADRFMRVHRSYLVNLNNITVIERSQIVFDKVRITVSDKYKDAFHQFMDKRFI